MMVASVNEAHSVHITWISEKFTLYKKMEMCSDTRDWHSMSVHSTQYLSDYVMYGTLYSYLLTEGSPLPPTG